VRFTKQDFGLPNAWLEKVSEIHLPDLSFKLVAEGRGKTIEPFFLDRSIEVRQASRNDQNRTRRQINHAIRHAFRCSFFG
jgi:hypothetical protein